MITKVCGFVSEMYWVHHYLSSQIADALQAGSTASVQDVSIRRTLLDWSRRMVQGYPNVQISDFTESWKDGRAFLSIIHRKRYVKSISDWQIMNDCFKPPFDESLAIDVSCVYTYWLFTAS